MDLFFDAENYERAKGFLSPLAVEVESEEKRKKHLAMTIDPWLVELHGLMPTEISERINAGMERVQSDIFAGGGVRVWKNDGVDVPLPSPDNDVIIVFTHFLQHFFCGGVGLRQICDWCRFLYTFKGQFDLQLLENRLKEMKVMTEWKVFGVIAVEKLGLPEKAFPFYEVSSRYRRKAEKVLKVILEVGNFGHNRDKSYFKKHSYLVRKAISLWKNGGYIVHNIGIFPANSLKYLPRFLFGGFRATAKGK